MNDATRKAIQALIEKLPKCDYCPNPEVGVVRYEQACDERGVHYGYARVCDEHLEGTDEEDDYDDRPYAPAMRKLQRLLRDGA